MPASFRRQGAYNIQLMTVTHISVHSNSGVFFSSYNCNILQLGPHWVRNSVVVEGEFCCVFVNIITCYYGIANSGILIISV